MSDALTTIIIGAATDKALKQIPFTAYEITQEVRLVVGRGTNVPHSDVRQEVHTLFQNDQLPGYTRTLANLRLAPGIDQPWIYHPPGVDLSKYGLGSHQSAVLPQTSVSPAPDSGDEEDDNDDGCGRQANGSYKVDSRATLCLPASLVRQLGLTTGDEAFCFVNPLDNCVVVLKDATPNVALGPLTQLVSYTVNGDYNVRITQSTFQRAGIPGQFYQIDGDANRVSIRPWK